MKQTDFSAAFVQKIK